MKKNNLIILIIVIIVIFITFTNYLIYNRYYNDKLIDIANEIVLKNPNVKVNEIADILKNPISSDNNVLKKYGYYRNDIYLTNDIKNKIFLNILINTLVAIIITLIFITLNNRKTTKRKKEINQLIKYLEEINSGNYNVDINKYSESDFSKLHNYSYKIMSILKEYNTYLNKERLILKNNIADVSHQLKTPLTSSSLMIETLLEDEDMSKSKQREYLTKVYEKNEKITYLVEVLLKLSKLETSTIEFKKNKVNVSKLLTNVLNNVKALASKNNVDIKINVDENIKMVCDEKWQEEAITNIIKNSIEFSNKNGIISIDVEDNNFYTLIKIKDNGKGIKNEDINKIFDRFHKSENSKGVGIGLNLAKTIIEKDNGIIEVKSKYGEYTIFNIKYIKNM